jgi:[ribosomal protein S5]-alanine N-acetyltransferase
MAVEKSPNATFPSVGLVGEKTRLVRFDNSDITDKYLNWLNDPTVVRYSNQRFKHHSIESSRAYLASFENTDNLFLSIRRISGGNAIGTLTIYAAMPHGTADIGILIGATKEWGNGYGLDVWQTASNWLIEYCGMRKVTGGTLSCNEGMKKIFERSGMHLECTRRAQEIVEGIPMDTLYYARFRNA